MVPALIILAVLMIGTGIFVRFASRRYERRQILAGKWDENGPLHPSAPKPWEVVSRHSLGLRLDDSATGSTRDDSSDPQ
jgi:hypothetical protein